MRVLRLGTISAVALLCFHAHAWAGNGSDRGGGSSFEERVNQIRADLLIWIDDGGADDFTFGPGENASLYVSSMRPLLQEHAVSVEFVTDAIQAQAIRDHNLEKIVQINEHYKECRCFFSKKEQKNKILCRSDVFPKDSTPAGNPDFVGETKQYRLIHHEFAGLAGMEHNVGADSDYHLSDQITASLWPEVHEKLHVRGRGHVQEPCDSNKLRWKDFPYRCTTPSVPNGQEPVEWRVEERDYRQMPVYYDTKSGYSVTSVVDFDLDGRTMFPDPPTPIAPHYLDWNGSDAVPTPPYVDANTLCDAEQGFRLPTKDEFVSLLQDGLQNVLFGLRLRDHLTDDQARKLFGEKQTQQRCQDWNGEDYPGKGMFSPSDQATEKNPEVSCVLWSGLSKMSVIATGVSEAESKIKVWAFPEDRSGLRWMFNRVGAVPFCVRKMSQ